MPEGKKGAVEDNSIDFLGTYGTMKTTFLYTIFLLLPTLTGVKDAAYSLAKSRAVGPFVER